MPQMSPMLWLYMYMYFIIIMILFIVMIYYLNIFKLNKFIKLNNMYYNYKFKW